VFEALSRELAQWAMAGRQAQFWWRDDDAQFASPELDQILEISSNCKAPLSLAVIPHGVEDTLAAALVGLESVQVLQHGYSHENHAPADLRKMELGWHRPAEVICAQLRTGFDALRALFDEQFIPVMVPPWNRIDERIIEQLPDVGLRGLSTLGPRRSTLVAEVLHQVNVHVDIINWKQGRKFAGLEICEAQIIAHLSAKRNGQAPTDEPTGIMSHHRVHDMASDAFLQALFSYLGDHSAVSMLDAQQVF